MRNSCSRPSPRHFGFFVASLLMMLIGHSIAHSADLRQFPYTAVVMSERVEVRGGPGERFYVTGHLKTNTQVTVHRHDPGGWYMIAPPTGSFSWIDANLVQPGQGDTGVVDVPRDPSGQQGRAIVRIGSELSDDHSFYGRELSTGDEVRILGEKTLNTERGAVRMYKIAPPMLEYRWVKGDYIVPQDEAARQANDRDPFATPIATLEERIASAPVANPVTSQPQFNNPVQVRPTPTVSQTGPTLGQEASFATNEVAVGQPLDVASAFDSLDAQYRAMLPLSPDKWDIEGLANGYGDLLPHAKPEQPQLILQRLNALETRSQIQADYVTLVSGVQPEQTVTEINGTAPQLGPPPAQLGTPGDFPQQSQQAAQPMPQMVAPQAGPEGVRPRLDGAGVVQQTQSTQPGLPAFSLVTPDGRFLTYLHPGQGVDLSGTIGKSVGVIGQRSHDPRVRADVIVVRQVLPVQLAE